jgi:hypothetical protein
MCLVQRTVYVILAGNMMERYHMEDEIPAQLGCYTEQTGTYLPMLGQTIGHGFKRPLKL